MKFVLQGDDTALNNIRIECCDVFSPAKSCSPSDEWKRVLICDNTQGLEKKICKFERRIGVGYSDQIDPERPYAKEYFKSAGFTLEKDLANLKENMRHFSGKMNSGVMDWIGINDKVWKSDLDVSIENIEVPPHSSMEL